MDEESKILHSAEHVFARSLQNLGLDIHVRKADTDEPGDFGKAFIKETIPIEKIEEAAESTNTELSKNLEISEYEFENMAKALEKFNKLRFNEDRIDKEGRIRVIKIGDFDYSACKHQHVKNTGEIGLFVVTKVKYLGGETEIDFLAGKKAAEYAIKQSNAALDVSMHNNLSINQINRFIDDLKARLKGSEKEGEDLLRLLLSESKSSILVLKGVKLSEKMPTVSKFLKDNPDRCVALLNETQIFISRGEKNSTDIKTAAENLKAENLFIGSYDDMHLSGKLTDVDRVKEAILNFIH